MAAAVFTDQVTARPSQRFWCKRSQPAQLAKHRQDDDHDQKQADKLDHALQPVALHHGAVFHLGQRARGDFGPKRPQSKAR